MREGTVVARVVRSGLEESLHLGHVAVCDASGSVVARAGDPERLLFARSAMKPLQAAVSLRAIDDDLPDDELAVMCSSHNGEAVHVSAVTALLGRGGFSEDDLGCPPSWPLDPRAAAEAGRERRLLHNCSGKHAGKLLACRRQGWETKGYLDPSHPLQARIHSGVLGFTRLDEVSMGVDGCGSPVHGLPLASMAVLYVRFGSDDVWGGLGEPARRCTAAMRAHPYLVAGRARVDTALMEAAPGVFVKGGSEGLLCAGVPERSLGVAVKVADGNSRAAGPALISVLRQLEVLDDAVVDSLQAQARPPVLGGGRVIGELRAAVHLEP